MSYTISDATGRLVSSADNKGNSNVFTRDINDGVDTERVFVAGVSPDVGDVKLDNDYNQRGLRTKVLRPVIAGHTSHMWPSYQRRLWAPRGIFRIAGNGSCRESW